MSTGDVFKITDDFISIDKLDFFGPFHCSENGRFILAWSDYDPKSRIGGAREKGYGRYVLLDEGKIILQGKLERPIPGLDHGYGLAGLHAALVR